ncbi:patatin-like phospholipase family protein [Oceanicella sp. SM1341]|uniref:patatin-like phospholipase family protein n=1 Tax=Oceanicella sp. SM1341 TaxID=1548889 RepID=UPI001E58B114|nr:patatin-like phospholipase family protein [Oceanicella sp. SM1341]
MHGMATKPVCLALQGGGSHGAFTWGVLDKLLEDGRIAVSAISGTSAGAMNAVVMAEGLFEGGREGAREFLHRFWKKTAEAARLSPIQRSPLNVLMGDWSLNNSFGYHVMDAMSRVISPYQSNPLNLNPLSDLLAEVVDFERVRRCHDVQLFISATNVETGRVKVFRREELTLEMVLASACLPYLYQAVEIDGVPYWDGGYMGNPSMFPFYEVKDTRDIVLIQINPMLRAGTPTTAHEITDRINEITFNASLQKDLRAIEFVRRLIDAGRLDPAEYRYLDVHVIENQEVLNPLGASSKLNAEWAFLTWLRDIGRMTAEAWLDQHFDDLGRCSTVDIRGMFQGGHRVKQPD